MQSDRLVKICLVVMTLLLVTIALRPVFGPVNAYAQKHYEYELVRVSAGDVQDVLAKRTKENWEPVTLVFHGSGPNGYAEGFMLLRK